MGKGDPVTHSSTGQSATTAIGDVQTVTPSERQREFLAATELDVAILLNRELRSALHAVMELAKAKKLFPGADCLEGKFNTTRFLSDEIGMTDEHRANDTGAAPLSNEQERLVRENLELANAVRSLTATCLQQIALADMHLKKRKASKRPPSIARPGLSFETLVQHIPQGLEQNTSPVIETSQRGDRELTEL